MLRLLSPVFCSLLMAATILPVRALELAKVDGSPALDWLGARVIGRVAVDLAHAQPRVYRFQWPGVYFDAAFDGPALYLRTGEGKAIFHLTIDDRPALKLINAGGALYRVDGLAPGPHHVRFQLVTECQGGPVEFCGFAVPKGTAMTTALPEPPKRQIEFIGDSYTVGYGNTSDGRTCTPEEVWSKTDTSQAFAAIVAKRYEADYEINAISGRGIVRNYDGVAGDFLPQAYPFALFDHSQPAKRARWAPQVIVIGLGGNDFSTPLHPTEKWTTREELRADYEKEYVRFVSQVRTQHPRAFLILAADDGSKGEIQAEVHKVLERLKAAGETRLGYVEYLHLELTGCDWHPSVKDHRYMAAVIEQFLDAHPEAWQN